MPAQSQNQGSLNRRRRPPRPVHSLPSSTLSPLRITTQILILQASYYACITALILFTALTAGKPFSFDLVLSWRSLRGDTAVGWTLGLCWLVGGGLSGTILILLLIARSKLVPDFALTLHAIHLLITSLYSRSLPANALWWLLQAGSATLMVIGGVWSCRWRELRPMSFGGGGTNENGTAAKSKGRDGRGKNIFGSASGGGEYEMLNMMEDGRTREARG